MTASLWHSIAAPMQSRSIPAAVAVVVVAMGASFLIGGRVVEIDISTVARDRALALGEPMALVSGMTALVLCRNRLSEWELGRPRSRWLAAATVVVILLAAIAPAATTAWTIAESNGADTKWMVPIVNAAIALAAAVICCVFLGEVRAITVVGSAYIAMILVQSGIPALGRWLPLAQFGPAFTVVDAVLLVLAALLCVLAVVTGFVYSGAQLSRLSQREEVV